MKKEKHYPLWMSNKRYKKLLVIQTVPEAHVWFKDVEIDMDKLTEILDNIIEIPEL